MLILPTKEMVNGCLLYKLITPSGSAHEWRHKSKNLVHALTHHHLLEITQVCCPGHLVTLSHSLSHSHAGLTSRRSRRPDSDWDRSLDPALDRGPGPGRWLEECRDSNCGFIDKWILQQRGSCVYLKCAMTHIHSSDHNCNCIPTNWHFPSRLVCQIFCGIFWLLSDVRHAWCLEYSGVW